MNILRFAPKCLWLLTLFTILNTFVVTAAEPPEIGKEEGIDITPLLPKQIGSYHYDFRLPIQQGQRFHFKLNPVPGAEIKTEIVISTEDTGHPKGKIFTRSGLGLSHDWTMPKRPPGNALLISIRAKSLGQLKLKIDKVKD